MKGTFPLPATTALRNVCEGKGGITNFRSGVVTHVQICDVNSLPAA